MKILLTNRKKESLVSEGIVNEGLVTITSQRPNSLIITIGEVYYLLIKKKERRFFILLNK